MAPCCTYVDVRGDGKGILADLNIQSLREAWYSASAQKLRIAHLDNNLDEVAPFCKLCRDWRISSPPGEKIWTEKFKSRMRQEIIKEVRNV